SGGVIDMTDSSAAAIPTWSTDEKRSGSAALQHIKVQGAVTAPGEYPFEENTDVLHYLKKAGGATTEVRLCKVMIIRNYGPQNRTLVFRLDENGALPKVKSGDVLVFDKADALGTLSIA